MVYSVPLSDVAAKMNLTLANNVPLEGRVISYAEVNRPALQLAGFYEYFDSYRLQVLGLVEYAFLDRMSGRERDEVIKKLFAHDIPCIVVCRGMTPLEEMLRHGDSCGVPVLVSRDQTSDFMGEIIRWLKVELAPRVVVHGALVDIYGEGVLITGDSGIGKSETALELIKRGHRLVADDSVEIKKVSSQTLIGQCPDIIKYFIELRGIGIIDIRQMFGVESIKATQTINLVIKLEMWDDVNESQRDRLGLSDEQTEILGNSVVCHRIPVRPGRNIALICEAAAVNHRQKRMGYDAAKELSARLDRRNKALEKEIEEEERKRQGL